MKFCYVDESGLGDEPILTMAGVIVDGHRMHVTKALWDEFLARLSEVCGRPIHEFHARDFYSGNGPWRAIGGLTRARVITAILDWVDRRRHKVTFTAIQKVRFDAARGTNHHVRDCDSLWRLAALHTVLAIQRAHQGIAKQKGHTLFVFDREPAEEPALSQLVRHPPGWTDDYYSRRPAQPQLDQIIDVPYFADSRPVLLIQVADLIAYLLRRYAEIQEGLGEARYADEPARLGEWAERIASPSLSVATSTTTLRFY